MRKGRLFSMRGLAFSCGFEEEKKIGAHLEEFIFVG